MIYDLITTSGAYFLALLLRFDFRFSMIDPFYLIAWERFAPFYAVYCVIIFWALRLYKSLWRFASFTELERITVATLITTVVHAIVITLVIGRMPLSYYIFGAFLQFLFTVAIRFAYRFILLLRARKGDDNLKNVMLIGAGAAGQMILRDIRRTGELKERIVCIIDDNRNKWNVSNLVSQPGETDGYSVSDHVEVLNRYLGERKVDVVIANNGVVEEDVAGVYQGENKSVVELDMGEGVIADDIVVVDEAGSVRHDALKTAYLVFSYLMEMEREGE